MLDDNGKTPGSYVILQQFLNNDKGIDQELKNKRKFLSTDIIPVDQDGFSPLSKYMESFQKIQHSIYIGPS